MPFRIVIDTNIWISYLLTTRYSFLDTLIQKDQIILLYNEELISEISEVALRPKFQNIINPGHLLSLVKMLEGLGEYVSTHTDLSISRDHKDNFLLSLAVDGDADFLLSGDKDLLVLKKIGKTTILNITEFTDLISSS